MSVPRPRLASTPTPYLPNSLALTRSGSPGCCRCIDTYLLAQVRLRRWAPPEKVVKPVCFLLSDGASYVPGQHLSGNDGYTIGL
ncbi:hypothetical protein [Cupriavidus pinatubonensis]|uniref:Uncharacterized protein n=1 Tax=Cupriavidus pinatubonensis TaxID=248026 RepID=A0ABM8WFM9_9BURK|nr:hypothetical protein LMG23994_00909 [Cupriavidus pinatubonensis]